MERLKFWRDWVRSNKNTVPSCLYRTAKSRAVSPCQVFNLRLRKLKFPGVTDKKLDNISKIVPGEFSQIFDFVPRNYWPCFCFRLWKTLMWSNRHKSTAKKEEFKMPSITQDQPRGRANSWQHWCDPSWMPCVVTCTPEIFSMISRTWSHDK